jgi:dTDP-glucose 4,6-dehydratase
VLVTILVTGGAGFIGSNFVQNFIKASDEMVVNVDLLTYAGNGENLAGLENNSRHIFVKGDIGDYDLLSSLMCSHLPRAVLNFAAESHVDRSILAPDKFIKTNVLGTFNLLKCAQQYWDNSVGSEHYDFKFLHVSTDEVYGSLGPNDSPFTENHRYTPNSPYSASKAASDHFVRAWHHTYGLPVLTTNCSNNYGPYQFPEKLIPLVILNALQGVEIPVYGDGMQIRDWLHVNDHCSAISAVLKSGQAGEVYNVGGDSEASNIEVVIKICKTLDEMLPSIEGPYSRLISFVKDRPGHDRRYSINNRKIKKELGWRPVESFESGLRKTVKWYLNNKLWVKNVQSGSYRDWIKSQYNQDSNHR